MIFPLLRNRLQAAGKPDERNNLVVNAARSCNGKGPEKAKTWSRNVWTLTRHPWQTAGRESQMPDVFLQITSDLTKSDGNCIISSDSDVEIEIYPVYLNLQATPH